jgi:glucose-1-phosphate thymidylyltransferase
VEDRQGMMISCVEEIAYRMGYIDEDCLRNCAEPLASNEYGQYLLRFLSEQGK